jgi:hypothetical protein
VKNREELDVVQSQGDILPNPRRISGALTSIDLTGTKRAMLRKGFAVFIIASLVLLAGVDLFEDLDFLENSGFDNPENETEPNGSPGFDLVRNVIECGNLTRLSCFTLWELPDIASLLARPSVHYNSVNIHKLKRVFLI